MKPSLRALAAAPAAASLLLLAGCGPLPIDRFVPWLSSDESAQGSGDASGSAGNGDDEVVEATATAPGAGQSPGGADSGAADPSGATITCPSGYSAHSWGRTAEFEVLICADSAGGGEYRYIAGSSAKGYTHLSASEDGAGAFTASNGATSYRADAQSLTIMKDGKILKQQAWIDGTFGSAGAGGE
ncbi:hypothetical protein BRM1_08060 [Brevibacterium sp. BRM-1]|uniref:hypothetical protein n=1 Tax=Brevibacterium sp. BRM-1 TaxID=2999062 RepID=UPI0022828E18|nr:hypothetical protein [Brevibacterium sp. BRM-1]WAL39243.1 hypothetical protein BRM1_08060 [Brevibacterium sp. BRM-1]